MNTSPKPKTPHNLNQQILTLALPALGTLIVQPLLTTVDTAMVGHLGTSELAGLAISSTILITTFGLFVFLAYSTTSLTAKHFGAGNQKAGLQAGLDALWLALFCGVITTSFLLYYSPTLIGLFGTSADTLPHANAYLYFAAPGLIGMLLSLAATGTLRGLLDTRTPLVVATVGAAVNALLNAILIFGFNLGITGSALGTALAELGMGGFLTYRVLKACKTHQVHALPNFQGIFKATLTGAPLMFRTLSMRVCLLFTVVTLTQAGDLSVAGNQIVATIWGFAIFSLDALAIAAQALIGRSLGAKNSRQAQELLRTLSRWGIIAGTLLGIFVAATSPLLPYLFTSDPALTKIATLGLLYSAPFYPLAGYVFVLDGILIGAGDNLYLAFAATFVMALFLPALWVYYALTLKDAVISLSSQSDALASIWLLFGIFFIGGRALTLYWRTRQTTWQHLNLS
ncbi:MATE family efflux transporter [Gleimia sp. 6138-11-ORH1]|uniref:MATE family efflux transporter n=1 Tax=Gleimia sp. 6138-11-ORH1 TaxID=2973937 RepID=UPI0021687E87|nr:MATE family efflux transporter [Gleimia sp. 6138-11-ORH1]MCS4485155.1 MATE family efflux transporter [Gleimia sp. 6138-11-ORH1]